MNAFVGEIHGDAQPGLFYKPALHSINGFGMVTEGVTQVRYSIVLLPHPVQHLVNVGYAVFPYFLFPPRSRKRVFQHPSVAVEGGQLAGFLVDRHLCEQVVHPLL